MADAEQIENFRLRGALCGWAACLGGNAVFWLLGAGGLQFAVFDIAWLVIFSLRHPGASAGEGEGHRLGFLVFLLRVMIACDAATVIVDSLSPVPIG